MNEWMRDAQYKLAGRGLETHIAKAMAFQLTGVYDV
jgi:hypothetical protein